MKAYGRSLADFPDLTAAERALADCARKGDWWDASAPLPGETATAPRPHRVRGEFVRFLVLGGDDDAPVHEKGPRIRGAIISSDLDFTGCKDMRVFALENCEIEGSLLLEVAKAASIYLDGCKLTRVLGNRAEINGSLYMRFGFIARHGLDLSGSRVTGSVSCRGGTFHSGPPTPDEPVSYAFRMDDAEIVGTLIFGARQAGDLDGQNAKRNATVLRGIVSLQGTSCAALFDQKDTYDKVERGQLRIHGFRYGRLASVNAVSSKLRRTWLNKTQKDGEFTSPQTYEYLAGVLREMGHEDAARVILIDRHKMERHVMRRRRAKRSIERRDDVENETGRFKRHWLYRYARWIFGFLPRFFSRLWNKAFYTFVRYGYEPWRAIGWSLIPLVLGAVVFAMAYASGSMVPSDPAVANGKDWKECAKELKFPRPRSALLEIALLGEEQCKKLPEYPRFSAIWYSFDTFVPIVTVRQANYWTPSPAAPWVRQYGALHTVLGWLLVTLGLSSMLGLIQKRAAPGGK